MTTETADQKQIQVEQRNHYKRIKRLKIDKNPNKNHSSQNKNTNKKKQKRNTQKIEYQKKLRKTKRFMLK